MTANCVRSFVVALLLALVACTTPEPASSRRPNVLLVSIDTLRSDHLGAYGYDRDTSPTIDALSRNGVLFETAVSASSWTLPSHTTLLTGLPPELHGVDTSDERLVDAATTLAEVFRDQGYATAGFASGPYLRAVYGHGQGFDSYDESAVWSGDDVHRKPTSPRLEQLVVGWLDAWSARGRTSPFFLFVHMWDPHYDFSPPPPYDTMFDPDYDGDVTGVLFAETDQVRPGMDPRDLEHVVAMYDGEIRYTDEHLGRIVDALDRLGVADDTIVAVTSDHGEEFLEHGQKGHAKGLYDEIVRIPWVMRYPHKIRAGQRIEAQVRLMDVAPTLLGLAGIPPPGGFGTGGAGPNRERDLGPWLTGERPASTFPTLVAFSHENLWAFRSAIRTKAAKVIQIRKRDQKRIEQYDLAQDPGERTDLALGRRPQGHGRALFATLLAWRRQWKDRASPSAVVELEPRHVEQLRALGYVE